MAVGQKTSVAWVVLRYLVTGASIGVAMAAIMVGSAGLYHMGRLIGLGGTAIIPAAIFGTFAFIGLGGRLLMCAFDTLEE